MWFVQGSIPGLCVLVHLLPSHKMNQAASLLYSEEQKKRAIYNANP